MRRTHGKVMPPMGGGAGSAWLAKELTLPE
jgi:hypothetical protein